MAKVYTSVIITNNFQLYSPPLSPIIHAPGQKSRLLKRAN